MESFYGIGVKNRYEMFYDDDSDPVELLKKTQAKKIEKAAEKENKTKEKPKETTKKTDKPSNGNITEKRTDANHKDAPRDKKDFKKTERVRFSDREERNNQRNSEVAKDSKDKEGNSTNQRFNGETRGRGGRGGSGPTTGEFGRGGRGTRRGRGNWVDRGGKREFDRQSGMVNSGVKPVDKKDGAGSFNWGSNKEEMSNNFEADQENETAESPEKAKEAGGSETKENEFPKEEEGPKEMTLDEWKASQKREAPQFNLRKAGEGENNAQWKKTYVLKKKETDAGDETVGDAVETETNQGKRKILLPVDFQFSDAPMRGGRFRGRGRGLGTNRGRGRGARGGGSRYTTRAEAPKMDDEKMFPSLG